jgi:endonuclease/exonuclease/phosphatase family metal-dependent hydrolase
MARRRRRGWVGPVLVVALVLAWWLVGDRLRGPLGLPGDGRAPAKDGRLRIATWNLRNFPVEGHDLEKVRTRLGELQADVIAVQEIHDPEALQGLLPGWSLALSQHGGRGKQRLGFLYDPAQVELIGAPREHAELAMGGVVRPGFSGYLRARGGGPDFHVVVVHLKAKPDGHALRQAQWQALAEIVREVGRDDEDVVLLGDFNVTGSTGGSPSQELADLDARLAAVGARRLVNYAGCSAYWNGARRDAWHEPSLLDLVWFGGLREAGAVEARPLLHCARHRCVAFRSTESHPERDYADLSDHCPVIVDLVRGVDDDP